MFSSKELLFCPFLSLLDPSLSFSGFLKGKGSLRDNEGE